MLTTLLTALVALILGFAIGKIMANGKHKKEMDISRAEAEGMRAETERLRSEAEAAHCETNRIRSEAEAARTELAATKALLASERQFAAQEKERLEQEKAERAQVQAEERAEEARRRAEEEAKREKIEAERTAALREEFKAMAADAVKRESEQLRKEHVRRLDDLLRPLGENISAFQKQYLEGNASIDKYIKVLVEETKRVSGETEELTRALRGGSKQQGDWGEVVLERLLEISGLVRGREYFVQEQVVGEDGNALRPDVVVRFPGDRAIIIDSKVSLKDYTDYINADSATAAEESLKRHIASVRKHVKELSIKDYTKSVHDSIGYVLMFVPHEAAYVAAVSKDPELTSWAYRQHIIVLNPTNLLMALQLAYNLWQSEVRNKRVEEIYNSAAKVYEKFVGFAANFEKIGLATQRLQATYNDALGQLSTGRGNIIRQLQKWKDKGMQSKSQLPRFLEENCDGEEEREEQE